VSGAVDVPVGRRLEPRAPRRTQAQVEDAGFALPWSRASRCTRTSSWGARARSAHRQLLRSIASMGELRIPCCATTSLPVFDWTRTDLAMRLARRVHGARVRRSGARAIRSVARNRKSSRVAHRVPAADLLALLAATRDVGRGAPLGQPRAFSSASSGRGQAGVRLRSIPMIPPGPSSTAADHHQCQAWSARDAVDSPANGVTFCTGRSARAPRRSARHCFVVGKAHSHSPLPQRPDHG